MRLDQTCFDEHIASPAFQDGVARGYWNVAPRDGLEWPYVVIWIAAPQRPNSPDRLFLRFHLLDYPAKGPTATLWNFEKNEQLPVANWPKGSDNVGIVFRTDWHTGTALYAPWDRFTAEKHTADWIKGYPGLGWKSTHTIVFYLRQTREVLHTDEYRGC